MKDSDYMKLKKWVKVSIFILITSILALIILKFLNNNTKSNVENNNVISDSREEENSIKTAKLTLVGDFLYEEPYYEALRNGEDENKYFSLVEDYFQNDDLSIGNMEVVISDYLDVSGEGFSFCAPESIGKQVVDLGMDVLSLANNHSNDRGLEGRISTVNFFNEKSDILTVGVYDEKRDVTKNIIEVNGIKFGFLSYTYGTNVKISDDLRYSLGIFRDPDTKEFNEEYKTLIRNEVNTLKDLVDCIIVLTHWGNEFTYNKVEEQTSLAYFLNELGVDIIIGGHSHSIQPIEWINNKKNSTLVYYSLGNFVSADDDISRAGETFDNAYQFGILSQLEVSLNNNKLKISNITTEPIINYYDTNLKNFLLIPYSQYTYEYEVTHYRYKYNFTKDFVDATYKYVIDEDFR